MAKESKLEPTPENSPAAEETVKREEQEAASQAIRELSEALLSETETLRRQIDSSQLKQSLGELRRSTELFRALSEAALTGGFQAAPAAESPRVEPAKGCGCHGAAGCGPATKPSCCIELYVSMVEVVDGQHGVVEGLDKDELELIVAVQADGQSWGLAPGLNGSINVSKKAGGIALNAPIGRFCVPCGECRTIPLVAQAHEVEKLAAAGRAEYGSKPGFITIRCDCQVAPAPITVSLEGGGTGGGIVTIYTSARFIAGSCCGY